MVSVATLSLKGIQMKNKKQHFNFQNQFLIDESVASIRERLDTYSAVETLTWVIAKWGAATGIFLFKSAAAGLLKTKQIQAASNTDIMDIVVDGAGEIFDVLARDVQFVKFYVKFKFASSEDEEAILKIFNFITNKNASEEDIGRFNDEVFHYRTSHGCSPDEARLEVMKTFEFTGE